MSDVDKMNRPGIAGAVQMTKPLRAYPYATRPFCLAGASPPVLLAGSERQADVRIPQAGRLRFSVPLKGRLPDR